MTAARSLLALVERLGALSVEDQLLLYRTSDVARLSGQTVPVEPPEDGADAFYASRC